MTEETNPLSDLPSNDGDCPVDRCRCGSRVFVWMIPRQGVYSSPTAMSCLPDRINDSPRCYKCNRDLAADVALRMYWELQRASHKRLKANDQLRIVSSGARLSR